MKLEVIFVYVYPNKAVMEMHPDEPGSQPRIPGQGVDHGLPHDRLGRRATVLVETNLQWVRDWSKGKNSHGQQAQYPMNL